MYFFIYNKKSLYYSQCEILFLTIKTNFMAAHYSEIKSWFERGTQNEQNTHMIVVCDTFDYDDYPVYVSQDEDVHKVEKKCNEQSMQRVMEVYNLKKDMEEQLSMERCFCY